MPSICQPRRPRASPLWQILTTAWDTFLARYEKFHRPALGLLRLNVFTAVRNFLRCGDLASGFTRLQCPDCGHERLLAFTCKGRHFCPSCHQRRVRSTSDWIATAVCHEVPHRQFVFTIPKVLRGIFRKRRQLLTPLFHTATGTLRDAFRTRLHLPDGRIGAIAAVLRSEVHTVEHVAGDQAFVTELDEPVGNVCGIEPEVFGIEPLATAPVTDGSCDKDSPAADAIEEGLVLGTVVGVHDDVWLLVCMVQVKSETPAPVTGTGRALGDGTSQAACCR